MSAPPEAVAAVQKALAEHWIDWSRDLGWHCTCGLYVLAGLADYGNPVFVDYHPTTTAGEAFALLTGRDTYAIDNGQLYQRLSHHIGGRPADQEKTYATHVCGSPQLPANPRFAARQPVDYTQPPPF